MGIHTLGLIMFMIEWAPLGFEVKNVEIIVLVKRNQMVN